MKSNQLVILLVGAVVLGSLGWYVRSRDQQTLAVSKVRMGDPLFPGLDINAVGLLRIQTAGETLHVERKDSVWTVRERGGYPANFGTLADLLRKLADLKITQPVEVGASRHAALELDGPPDGGGTRVELIGTDGKVLRAFVVGLQTQRDDPSGFGGMPTGRYIRVLPDSGGTGGGSIAKVSDPLGTLHVRPGDWIRKDFIRVEQPVSVQVAPGGGGEGFHLERKDEFSDWALADAAPGDDLDTTRLGVYNSLLSFPSFSDVVVSPDASGLGLDNPTMATIRTSRGFTYVLQIGTPQEGDLYPVQLQVNGAFPSAREPVGEESETDRERLDGEFEADLKTRREKLAKEVELASWTYLVNRWTIDALLRTRADLMKSGDAPATDASDANPFGGDFDLDALLQNPELFREE